MGLLFTLWVFGTSAGLGAVDGAADGARFLRGDSNVDGTVDLSDGVDVLNYLFAEARIECSDAADVNDDGLVDISDAVFVLNFLFLNGAEIPPPGTENCGSDPTLDRLGCDQFGYCDVDCEDQGGDGDGDGICSDDDNCPGVFNPSQSDRDRDGVGDVCELFAVDDALPLHQTDAGDEENERDDAFGEAVVFGDFNGDELSDLAIGVPGKDGDEGRVIVFMGEPSGFGPGVVIVQEDATRRGDERDSDDDDRFGGALAAGDLDGDGFDELIAGAPGADNRRGIVFVWRGGADGLNQSGRFFFASDLSCGEESRGDEFGMALTTGDLNGDGLHDLAVGAPGSDDDEGWICVVSGARGGLERGEAEGVRWRQGDGPVPGTRAAGDRFGVALSAGPLSSRGGDGLVVGAPGDNGGGSVVVLRGKGGAREGDPVSEWFEEGRRLRADDVELAGVEPRGFGAALAVGRLGRGEAAGEAPAYALVVGAPESDDDRGALFVFENPASESMRGLAIAANAVETAIADAVVNATEGRIDGDVESRRFGYSVALADFDGDGNAEVAAGLPRASLGDIERCGAAIVLDDVLELTPDAIRNGALVGAVLFQELLGARSEDGDTFAQAIAAGNFNGDGAADLAIGTPGEAPLEPPLEREAEGAGQVYVVPGSPPEILLTQGPVLGASPNGEVRVWLRANREARAIVRLAGEEAASGAVLLTSSSDNTGVVCLRDLEPGSEFVYEVLLNDAPVYAGTFRTLPPQGDPAVFRFAFGCDINLAYRPFRIFDAIEEAEPAFRDGGRRQHLFRHTERDRGHPAGVRITLSANLGRAAPSQPHGIGADVLHVGRP